MKQLLLSLFSFFCIFVINAQTNPTALTLPVLEDFGTTTFSTTRPGMASWTGDGARPYITQAAAEASLGGADQAITAAEPASAGSGGQYGGAPSANARLSILQSSNATSGSSQIVMAINTTGASSVTVAYDLTMPVVNPRDFGIALQYRVGTSGAFTTVAGSAVVYSNVSTNGGDADGPTDFDNYSYSLPAAATNQAVVQLRWISWNPSGTGSRSAVGIDNISVTSGAVTPCAEPTAQPTALVLTPTASSIGGNFTAASPAPNNYLVVYSTANTLSAQPVDGTTYTAGQSLGGGTVAQIGATTFNVTGLAATTQYFFFIYSLNNVGCSGGPNYFTTAPLIGNTTTLAVPACVTPAAAATALILTPTSNTVNGSFTASASANRYLVVRSTAATLSASPVNGTTYTSGQSFGGGTIVQYSAATTFSVVGLTSNTAYNFFVFAANGGCTGEPFYRTPALTGAVTTLNGGVPSNYYTTANGLTCAALKTALYNIISTGTTVLSYTPGVWNAYQTTDIVRNFENNADIIYDMYSNKGPGVNEPYEYTYGTNQCGNYNAEAQCYNREHSMPQSWFNSASPMVSDIHHLVPSDGYVNGQRGNFPYGPVGTATYTSQNGSKKGNGIYPGFSGTVFEPINEFKGDFARMQLYMAVRYENLIASWQTNSNADDVLNGSSYQVFDAWYLKMLYDWHIQDPVSAKEISRNNAVYAIQGNRNPFIDSAQYVARIWSCTGLLGAAPATPVILNVNNKCITDANAKGKLSNPPATGVTVRLDGTVITYNTADSSFQYFTNGVTAAGNHTVRVEYTNGFGTSQKDSVYTVAAAITPTISISGTTSVIQGQFVNISSSISNGGAAPFYQWQDSTSGTGWTNISGNNSGISYLPTATGNKLRCLLTSNAGNCVSSTPVISNILVFTITPVTAINPVAANNFGIKLFPNPVVDYVWLTQLRLNDKWQTLHIQSIDGKQNLVQKNIQNLTSIKLDITPLSSGIYIVTLKRNSGGNAYIKFVKL
jgi:endonuclease I